MRFQVVVVEVGADVHAAPPQRKQRIVEVEQVRIVLVDQIAGAIVEILYIGNIRQRIVRMLRAVQPLRIEPLPPLIFSLRLHQVPIIGNAREVDLFYRLRATV